MVTAGCILHRRRVLLFSHLVDMDRAVTLLLILDATTATVRLVNVLIIKIPRVMKKCPSSPLPTCFAMPHSLSSRPNDMCLITARCCLCEVRVNSSQGMIEHFKNGHFAEEDFTRFSIMSESNDVPLYHVKLWVVKPS